MNVHGAYRIFAHDRLWTFKLCAFESQLRLWLLANNIKTSNISLKMINLHKVATSLQDCCQAWWKSGSQKQLRYPRLTLIFSKSLKLKWIQKWLDSTTQRAASTKEWEMDVNSSDQRMVRMRLDFGTCFLDFFNDRRKGLRLQQLSNIFYTRFIARRV